MISVINKIDCIYYLLLRRNNELQLCIIIDVCRSACLLLSAVCRHTPFSCTKHTVKNNKGQNNININAIVSVYIVPRHSSREFDVSHKTIYIFHSIIIICIITIKFQLNVVIQKKKYIL